MVKKKASEKIVDGKERESRLCSTDSDREREREREKEEEREKKKVRDNLEFIKVRGVKLE